MNENREIDEQIKQMIDAAGSAGDIEHAAIAAIALGLDISDYALNSAERDELAIRYPTAGAARVWCLEQIAAWAAERRRGVAIEAEIEFELESAVGPRVLYGDTDTAADVEAGIPDGYTVDWSSAVKISAPGCASRWSAPLVEMRPDGGYEWHKDYATSEPGPRGWITIIEDDDNADAEIAQLRAACLGWEIEWTGNGRQGADGVVYSEVRARPVKS